jgi:hypothetical protein
MNGFSPLEEIFVCALELGNPALRNAFLDMACIEDPQMRRNVDELLTIYPNADRFLRSAGLSIDKNTNQTL